jgi:hypothetical protein
MAPTTTTRITTTSATSHRVFRSVSRFSPLTQPGRKKEWWENMWFYGLYGRYSCSLYSFAVYLIAETFKTNYAPSDIARQEAIKRLTERGEKFEYPLPVDYRK